MNKKTIEISKYSFAYSVYWCTFKKMSISQVYYLVVVAKCEHIYIWVTYTVNCMPGVHKFLI